MKQIEALTEKLKNEGMSIKNWKNKRIYFSSAKDINAYIDFDDPENEDFEDLYSGCNLKVFSNANQHRNWLINRAKQMKHFYMTKLSEILKMEVCENWQDVIL